MLKGLYLIKAFAMTVSSVRCHKLFTNLITDCGISKCISCDKDKKCTRCQPGYRIDNGKCTGELYII